MANPPSPNALTRWKWTPQSNAPIPQATPHPTPETALDPLPAAAPRRLTPLAPWLLFGALASLVAIATFIGWTLWTWRSEQNALRQRDLAELQRREADWQANQLRQAAALEEIRQRLADAPPPAPPLPATLPATLPPSPSTPRPGLASPRSETAATRTSLRAPEAPPLAAPSPVPTPVASAPAPSSLTPPPATPPAPIPAASPERVKLSLPAESASDKETASNKPRRGFRKFITSSIFVDSAVLTSSLLVPPSIPLTLAQSRLGRRLTGRILKKTNTDKTLGAKVIRDVEDMPITQRRRR